MTSLQTITNIQQEQERCMKRERYYAYWNQHTGRWDVGQELTGKVVLGAVYHETKKEARDSIRHLKRHSSIGMRVDYGE